jgi:hypothetical protein
MEGNLIIITKTFVLRGNFHAIVKLIIYHNVRARIVNPKIRYICTMVLMKNILYDTYFKIIT